MAGGAVAREMGVEREQQSRKMGRKRERESAYKERWLREIIKKIERSEYFIEISCKIEELIWVFCKSDSVK